MNVDHEQMVEAAKWNRGTRYVLFEPDGKLKSSYDNCFSQRPAAEKRAGLFGVDVYDLREREVIVEPDRGVFVERLRRQLASYEKAAGYARVRLAELERDG